MSYSIDRLQPHPDEVALRLQQARYLLGRARTVVMGTVDNDGTPRTSAVLWGFYSTPLGEKGGPELAMDFWAYPTTTKIRNLANTDAIISLALTHSMYDYGALYMKARVSEATPEGQEYHLARLNELRRRRFMPKRTMAELRDRQHPMQLFTAHVIQATVPVRYFDPDDGRWRHDGQNPIAIEQLVGYEARKLNRVGYAVGQWLTWRHRPRRGPIG